MSVWTKLLHEILKMQWWLVVPATVLSVLQSALALASARSTGHLYDLLAGWGGAAARAAPAPAAAGATSAATGAPSVLRLVLWLCALQLADWALTVATGLLFGAARHAMTMDNRVAYFRSMVSQEPAFHDTHPSADLLVRLSGDPEQLVGARRLRVWPRSGVWLPRAPSLPTHPPTHPLYHTHTHTHTHTHAARSMSS